MQTLKITLEYDGTRYSGWQEQSNARTVVGELRKAAQQVFGGDVDLHGAGRTDAGVHALGQVMHLKSARPIRHNPESIQQRMNDILPADIVILNVETASRTFHARRDAISRVYVYQLSLRKQAFTKKFVWWVKKEIDLDPMLKAAAKLRGRHDFVCFRAEDRSRPEESTIVVVESVDIEVEEDIVQIRIEASHFLWRMVRRIVGVLVKLGTREIKEEDFDKLLAGKCSPELDVAAWTAPAAGLFLEAVRYGNERDRAPLRS